MHRRQAPVEGAPELEIVVELPGRSDVQLHAVEERQAVAELGLAGANQGPLIEEGLATDARERAFGVVGEREHPEPARARRGDDVVERGAPVTRYVGVHVEVADHLAHRGRQGSGLGRLDLAGILAEDGRDERETERLVDLLLGLAGDDAPSLDLRERVLVQGQPARERALAQLDVVSLRSREVEQRRADLGRGHDPHVNLEAALGDDAGLRLAAGQHPVDHRQRHQRLHDRLGGRRDHHDVDVPDRLRETAQRAAGRRVGHARDFLQAGHHPVRDRQRHRDRRASGAALLVEALERPHELLLRLLAEAPQRAQPVRGQGGAQVVDRLHVELRAQTRHGLWSEAGQAHQRQHARRVLGAEALQLGDLAGLDQLADLLRRALADVLDLLQILDGQAPEVGRLGRDGVRGVLVGAHAEGLRIAFVEDGELGELAQHVQDVLLRISHGDALDVAWISWRRKESPIGGSGRGTGRGPRASPLCSVSWRRALRRSRRRRRGWPPRGARGRGTISLSRAGRRWPGRGSPRAAASRSPRRGPKHDTARRSPRR